VTAEVIGVPDSAEMKEFVKTTLFFYQIANEEILMNKLIEESKRCLEEK
jgi:hypothetical protein